MGACAFAAFHLKLAWCNALRRGAAGQPAQVFYRE